MKNQIEQKLSPEKSVKSIKILGVDYKVVYSEQIDKYSKILGQINYVDKTIEIDKALSKDIEGLTLLHEILHGIFNLLGYQDYRDDEQLVQSLSATLHQVLKDNKEFIFSLMS